MVPVLVRDMDIDVVNMMKLHRFVLLGDVL
jgi:hypothetical protein